ncbi:MAG: hypothetical protein AAFU71_09465 [Cyanobacteria bacterium J06632_22]
MSTNFQTGTNTPDTITSNKPIKWSWLALSCASLLTGMFYLATIELTGPVTVSQVQSQQAE